MKKATYIFIIGLVALFVLQSIWIITSYNAETRKITSEIDEMLTHAIQVEVTTRRLGDYKDKDDPKFVSKIVQAPPSIEEIKKEGLDTISLKDAKQLNIGENVAELIGQVIQDGFCQLSFTVQPVEVFRHCCGCGKLSDGVEPRICSQQLKHLRVVVA